ncbi:MAG: hypothetical protein L0Y72_08255 [Gemmataceae bacterium]|nr:hypothetical protein [Gemmataceae bacterium]MCI0739021.1 hypothetical protein [Gemmataceae bacterium]
MRRLWSLAAVAVLALANTGCFINMWSSDPNERTEQLIHWSENLRQVKGEWNRFWFNDQPSHLTPMTIHGGIGPGI